MASRATKKPEGPVVEGRLVPMWPDAGRILGFSSRSATYGAEAKGFIATIPVRPHIKRVSTRWLDRVLDGEVRLPLPRSAPAPARVEETTPPQHRRRGRPRRNPPAEEAGSPEAAATASGPP